MPHWSVVIGLTLLVPCSALADGEVPEPSIEAATPDAGRAAPPSIPPNWSERTVMIGERQPIAIGETGFNRTDTIGAIWKYTGSGDLCSRLKETVRCGVGMFCVAGCAPVGTNVGLFVEDRLLATAFAANDQAWFAEVPINELERGREVTAKNVGPQTMVLGDSSWNTLWGLTVEGGATWKERFGPSGSTRIGMFVAVAPALRPVVGSPWFGVHLRYAAAQVSDEALHRVGIGVNFDLMEAAHDAGPNGKKTTYRGFRVVLSATVGGAFFFQNSTTGGSAIVAGPTVGGSIQLLFPIARPVSVVLRSSYEWFLQGSQSFQIVDLASLGALAEF